MSNKLPRLYEVKLPSESAVRDWLAKQTFPLTKCDVLYAATAIILQLKERRKKKWVGWMIYLQPHDLCIHKTLKKSALKLGIIVSITYMDYLLSKNDKS